MVLNTGPNLTWEEVLKLRGLFYAVIKKTKITMYRERRRENQIKLPL